MPQKLPNDLPKDARVTVHFPWKTGPNQFQTVNPSQARELLQHSQNKLAGFVRDPSEVSPPEGFTPRNTNRKGIGRGGKPNVIDLPWKRIVELADNWDMSKGLPGSRGGKKSTLKNSSVNVPESSPVQGIEVFGSPTQGAWLRKVVKQNRWTSVSELPGGVGPRIKEIVRVVESAKKSLKSDTTQEPAFEQKQIKTRERPIRSAGRSADKPVSRISESAGQKPVRALSSGLNNVVGKDVLAGEDGEASATSTDQPADSGSAGGALSGLSKQQKLLGGVLAAGAAYALLA